MSSWRSRRRSARPPATAFVSPLMTVLAGAAFALAASTATAATHGLVMWIGHYAEPSVKLKGAEADAALARGMAYRLGVPPDRLLELHDQQLSLQGMRLAWATLLDRVQPGDDVFVYFSGHGAQRGKSDGSGCSEGLVTYDGRVYFDVQLRDQLERLARKAGRIWMFNDACHAGGAVSKAMPNLDQPPDADAMQVKLYPLPVNDADEPQAKAASDGAAPPGGCGTPVNVAKAFEGLGNAPTAADKVLYLAAAADNEAAFGDEQGSAATRAWAACLQTGQAYTGNGLARCAQQWLHTRLPRFRQTITVRLNGDLALPAARRP